MCIERERHTHTCMYIYADPGRGAQWWSRTLAGRKPTAVSLVYCPYII